MNRYLPRKVAFRLFTLAVYLLPTLFFVDIGARWANTGLYLPVVQNIPPESELSSKLTELQGNFWRLMLAYFLIGVLALSKFRKRRSAWLTALKVVVTNFCFGLTAWIVCTALSPMAFPSWLGFFSGFSRAYFSSYCVSMFSIWGKPTEPIVNALAQVIFAPLIMLFGRATVGRVRPYDRLAMWSESFKPGEQLVMSADKLSLTNKESGYALQTRSNCGTAVRPGQKAIVEDDELSGEVAEAVAAKNQEDAERKLRQYIV